MFFPARPELRLQKKNPEAFAGLRGLIFVIVRPLHPARTLDCWPCWTCVWRDELWIEVILFSGTLYRLSRPKVKNRAGNCPWGIMCRIRDSGRERREGRSRRRDTNHRIGGDA